MIEDVVLIVYFCLLIPCVFMLGILKGKSKTVFGFMLIGVTIGLLASQVNPILLLLSAKDYFYVTTNLTPLCEEILKALPVLFYAFVVSKKPQNVLEVAFAVGIGFAIFENTTFMLQNGSPNLFWILGRGIGAGLMHAVCTGAVGLGLCLTSAHKRMLLPGIFAVLIVAAIYHCIFNVMVETESMKYIGICLPILTYIPVVIFAIRYLTRQKEHKQSE